MCDQWWDERLLREEVEKLKRSAIPPAPAPQPEKETPQRKPENQPDPVPV